LALISISINNVSFLIIKSLCFLIAEEDAARPEEIEKLSQELADLRVDNERLRSQLQQLEQTHQQAQTANQNGELEGQMSSAIMDSFQVTPAKHGEMAVFSMFRPESSGEVVNSRVESELKLTRSQLECLEVESMELNRELVACRSENVLLTQEIDKVKKDQEDLLVLLADQDSQIQKYKDRLKNLGQPVSDEEDVDESLDDLPDDEAGELSL